MAISFFGYIWLLRYLHRITYRKEEHCPQRNRFCMFIDRRTKKKSDTVMIFDPPQSCCNIPRRHVHESYFDVEAHDIIIKQGMITSDSQVFGQLTIVSCRVEATCQSVFVLDGSIHARILYILMICPTCLPYNGTQNHKSTKWCISTNEVS
eukprot:693430_1